MINVNDCPFCGCSNLHLQITSNEVPLDSFQLELTRNISCKDCGLRAPYSRKIYDDRETDHQIPFYSLSEKEKNQMRHEVMLQAINLWNQIKKNHSSSNP